MEWTQKQLSDVIEWNEAWLLSRAGVTGVGVTHDASGNPQVEIATDSVTPDVRRAVEQRLDGVPVVFTNAGRRGPT
jgi:hypothetical protein